MDLETSRNELVQEAREQLSVLENGVLAMEHSGVGGSAIHEVFRAVHTIKGSAGIFALDPLVRFAHEVESALEGIRSQARPVRKTDAELLFACKDYLTGMINELEQGKNEVTPDPVQGESLRKRLLAMTTPVPGPADVSQKWNLELNLQENSLQQGIDPLALLQYIQQYGAISNLQTLADSLPAAAKLDPERLYLKFKMQYASTLNRDTLLELFKLAEGCSVQFEPVEEACPVVKQVSSLPRKEQRYLRVEVEKLDRLIDLVGEMVIASATAKVEAKNQEQAVRLESLDMVQALVESIRGASLALRMVHIGEVFSRFPRVVHDLCKEIGKEVQLEISGAETELDKSIVEKLVDPLTHLLRNAIDHGIEAPAVRVAQGKPSVGIIHLRAWQEGGSVLIQVADDGAGLNSDKILEKARKKGLLAPEQVLNEKNMMRLIFAAGFSTAEQVTNLSGRGVGMDVVRQNIEQLHGQVDIVSESGKGCVFTLQLPLTLAIIDGLLFEAGDSLWVVPLDQVVECAELNDMDVYQNLVQMRGESFPILRLREMFQIGKHPQDKERIIVVHNGHQHLGIIVDRFVGEVQAVIKPLSRIFRNVKGISGTTILGSGQLAMVLDVAAVAQVHQSREVNLWKKQMERGVVHEIV